MQHVAEQFNFDFMTFEQWMQKVNTAISNKIGLTSDDLPDCCYRDWFDDGISPKSAATMALKNSME